MFFSLRPRPWQCGKLPQADKRCTLDAAWGQSGIGRLISTEMLPSMFSDVEPLDFVKVYTTQWPGSLVGSQATPRTVWASAGVSLRMSARLRHLAAGGQEIL